MALLVALQQALPSGKQVVQVLVDSDGFIYTFDKFVRFYVQKKNIYASSETKNLDLIAQIILFQDISIGLCKLDREATKALQVRLNTNAANEDFLYYDLGLCNSKQVREAKSLTNQANNCQREKFWRMNINLEQQVSKEDKEKMLQLLIKYEIRSFSFE